jgi:hypothetical protein
MSNPTLLFSTKNERIDLTLQGVIKLYETVFPERLRAYYLVGSYGENAPTTGSDVDLFVVFKGSFQGNEEDKFYEVAQACYKITSLDLELHAFNEETMYQEGDVFIKSAGSLIFGEDIRSNLSFPTVKNWLRLIMPFTLSFRSMLHPDKPVFQYPLGYINPEAEFYGYERVKMRDKQGVPNIPSTRYLVGIATWQATALLARQTGKLVGRKSDCIKAYREFIGDSWTEPLEKIYYQCRNEWNYFIPENPAQRQEIKELCQQALAFENHFLLSFKDFLLAELKETELKCKLEALKYLSKIVYPGDEVIQTLQALETPEDEQLRTALEKCIEIQLAYRQK